MTSSHCEVWPRMYGIPNGTLEADRAANVAALGRNKSCASCVCAGPAHARYTHIWPRRDSAQHFLVLMHATCVCLRVCVCVVYGYHISAGHNSDSKSTSTPPVILSLCQQICLLFCSPPTSLSPSVTADLLVCVFYLKQTGIDYAKGYKSLEKPLYKLNQGLASFLQSGKLLFFFFSKVTRWKKVKW